MPPHSTEPDPHSDDLLSVTDDLLLTEDQLQQIMEETQPGSVPGEAMLQTASIPGIPPPPPPPPAPVPAARTATARQPTVVRRVTVVPASSRNSAGPLWAMAAVVLLAGGGAAWWLLQKKPAPVAEKESKVDSIVAALPGGANAAPPAGKTTAGKPARSNPVLTADLFDYAPAAPLKGLDGGLGWSGPWTGADTAIAAASLIGGLPAATGPGGHAVLKAAPQVTLSRPFASPPWDPKTGGEWWTSLLISQTGGDAAEDCELRVNLQSAAHIDAAIRLTLIQKGTLFQLTGPGAAKPLSFTWEAGAPIQFVARTTAKAAPKDTFDWQMDLWLNPLPDQLVKSSLKPDITLTAKAAAAPSFCGISFQKPARKAPATIRIDDILTGKAAGSVVH